MIPKETKTIRWSALFTTTALVCLLWGCDKGSPPVPAPSSAKSTASIPTPDAPAVPSQVARAVFIGQKKACDCTRKRIDEAWPVFQQAVAAHKNIEVKRLQLDVDEKEADRYDDMRTIMVAPGIFFLDQNDQLIEMVQGEVTAEQLKKILAK